MSGSTSYTQPPPVYEQARPHAAAKSNSVDEPLLSNSFADSPDEDIDDYKYGTTVSSSAIEIRNSFVRKVYTVLFLQLLGTTVVGATMKANDAQFWLMQNSWFMWIPLLGALGSMITLYFKRQSYPSNIALLGLFTIFESLSIGAVTCFYDTRIVLQALLITTFVFIGLTLFAMQTKYDLTSMGGVLYTVLLCFFFVGLLQIFFPFTGVAEMIYAGIGTLLFSGYILYDTQMIMNRLSPDEWVIGCLSLYLDTINLFLMILRLLNSTQQD